MCKIGMHGEKSTKNQYKGLFFFKKSCIKLGVGILTYISLLEMVFEGGFPGNNRKKKKTRKKSVLGVEV